MDERAFTVSDAFEIRESKLTIDFRFSRAHLGQVHSVILDQCSSTCMKDAEKPATARLLFKSLYSVDTGLKISILATTKPQAARLECSTAIPFSELDTQLHQISSQSQKSHRYRRMLRPTCDEQYSSTWLHLASS